MRRLNHSDRLNMREGSQDAFKAAAQAFEPLFERRISRVRQ